MKIFKTDILILSAIAIITLALCLFTIGKSPVDIQLYATYYVIPKYQWIVFLAAILSFLIFLFRAVIKRFNARSANLALLISFLLLSYMVFRAFQLFQM